MMRKTLPGEFKPPVFSYGIRDVRANKKVEVVFNQNRECFDYDVIRIQVGNEYAYVSRDDLAHVLLNGDNRTNAAVEEYSEGD